MENEQYIEELEEARYIHRHETVVKAVVHQIAVLDSLSHELEDHHALYEIADLVSDLSLHYLRLRSLP